jgi:hypothetical protein
MDFNYLRWIVSIMRQVCPVCAEVCVPAIGKSDVLVIGEFPSTEEVNQGVPFASNPKFMSAGRIFRKELERLGVSFNQLRIMNLWMHIPNKDERCFKLGYDAVLDEAKGKKAILLVGSDVVSTFTEYKVSDVTGLQVDSSVLSAPIIYAMVNPALAQHRALGEVRFGVEKFIHRLEKEGLL